MIFGDSPCGVQCRGVEGKCELPEFPEGTDDSTGLRSETTLSTPAAAVRVGRWQNAVTTAHHTTQQNYKKGSDSGWGPFLRFRDGLEKRSVCGVRRSVVLA